MKKYLLLSLFTLCALIAKAQDDSSDIVKVGQKMPAFSIISDNGKTFNSEELKGKVVLITFFATWCPPCQKELPEIEKYIWQKYKNNKDFRLLVIGREHNEDELTKYNEKKGFTFPLYPDKNRKIFGAFAQNLIPRNYLINKEGEVVYASKGYTPEDFAGLQKKLAELLK
ncbi:TlpA family protein disulfide reductase [Parabacteroides pacaensis]|uniref:TlpA family protein disulfide reductase n=1 Tax=Parabacteroides pacaensis TaxID=2086575 RepID=UPI000D0F83BC|nr:TlpA disulfide reductase family protein [Parabacteroides pacaensis]